MERAITITIDLHKREEWTATERAGELKELANSAGANVIREIIVHREKIEPALFIVPAH